MRALHEENGIRADDVEMQIVQGANSRRMQGQIDGQVRRPTSDLEHQTSIRHGTLFVCQQVCK